MPGDALTQLVLCSQLETLENIAIFYDISSIENLNKECILCKKILNNGLIKCLWCYNAVHKECMDKWLQKNEARCLYCKSDCYNVYNNFVKQGIHFKTHP